jgi:hypothetical protein
MQEIVIPLFLIDILTLSGTWYGVHLCSHLMDSINFLYDKTDKTSSSKRNKFESLL